MAPIVQPDTFFAKFANSLEQLRRRALESGIEIVKLRKQLGSVEDRYLEQERDISLLQELVDQEAKGNFVTNAPNGQNANNSISPTDSLGNSMAKKQSREVPLKEEEAMLDIRSKSPIHLENPVVETLEVCTTVEEAILDIRSKSPIDAVPIPPLSEPPLSKEATLQNPGPASIGGTLISTKPKKTDIDAFWNASARNERAGISEGSSPPKRSQVARRSKPFRPSRGRSLLGRGDVKRDQAPINPIPAEASEPAKETLAPSASTEILPAVLTPVSLTTVPTQAITDSEIRASLPQEGIKMEKLIAQFGKRVTEKNAFFELVRRNANYGSDKLLRPRTKTATTFSAVNTPPRRHLASKPITPATRPRLSSNITPSQIHMRNVKEAISALTPPANLRISRPAVTFSNAFLGYALGGNASVFSKVGPSMEGKQAFECSQMIKVNPDNHPLAPRAGFHGALTLVDGQEGEGEMRKIYPLFRKNGREWEYGGNYKIAKRITVPPEVWSSNEIFNEEFRKKIANTLNTTGWGQRLLMQKNLAYSEQELHDLTLNDILGFFERPSDEPHLRMSWILIQCLNYDVSHYQALVSAKYKFIQDDEHNNDHARGPSEAIELKPISLSSSDTEPPATARVETNQLNEKRLRQLSKFRNGDDSAGEQTTRSSEGIRSASRPSKRRRVPQAYESDDAWKASG
ncbi:MAG: hypothetical protein M1829_003564 [Trizodia sp. TS-e1964]|nr:MAG: hypothetical protein M1829_003564 [Trizodia sp. TS-e1964]